MLSVQAQAIDQLPEAEIEIIQLEKRLQAVDQQIESTEANANSSSVRSSGLENFFELSNIGLWLFWIILISLILLLLAIRRNLAVIPATTEPDVRQKRALRTKSTENAAMTAPRPSLVKPVKIVKIKVRKLKKSIRLKP